MPFFKKKPVTIEAKQWNDSTPANEIIDWITDSGETASYYCKDAGACARDEHTIAIFTRENLKGEYIHASRGDWVIKGVKGEFYPCKPDIFNETYEAAE